MSQELNPNTYVQSKYYELPLYALSDPMLNMLGLFLDKDVVPNPDGSVCDFSGLAHLIGLEPVIIDHCSKQKFRGLEVLKQWRESKLNPKLGDLLKYLAELGREDILTDMSPEIENDACTFTERHHSIWSLGPQPVSEGPSRPGPIRLHKGEHCSVDDVIHKQVTKYDAFISYAVGDLEFVKELIQRLEAEGLKLFVRERNGLSLGVDYENTTKLIQERCRHMIAVLSPNYVKSEECTFQVHYAFQLSPAQRKGKIVPILIEQCQMPEVLRIMALCDFTNKDFREWSWLRLIGSIMPDSSAFPDLQSSSNRSSLSSNGSDSGMNSQSLSGPSVPTSSGATSANSTSTSQKTKEQKSTSSSTSKASPSLTSRALQHIKAPFTSSNKKQRQK